MKKALFILMAFALIGFAGCKQAASSGTGGGGYGDNPLIGTWVNIDRRTNIDNENDWAEYKTIFTVKKDMITETEIISDCSPGFSEIKCVGFEYTMYYNYTISTEPNEHDDYVLELAPYDYTWDANDPTVKDYLTENNLTEEEYKTEAIESYCNYYGDGRKSWGRPYQLISDNTELIFGMEYPDNPGTYRACDPDIVYTKQ